VNALKRNARLKSFDFLTNYKCSDFLANSESFDFAAARLYIFNNYFFAF
jgi:hypothetical protein